MGAVRCGRGRERHVDRLGGEAVALGLGGDLARPTHRLHAFQHLPFHEALAAASATFETETYLPESRYRELHRRGRITDTDLRAVLAEHERGEAVADITPAGLSRLELERLALLHPLPAETEASLRWKMNEQSATTALRPDLAVNARERLLRHSLEGLRGGLDRVGRDWTMTDLAQALLEPTLNASGRAAAAEPQRALSQDVALRRLGIAPARAEAYLAQVRARLVGATASLSVEGWLGAEVSLVTEALATTFGGDGSLPSVKQQLERHPERFAVKALWAACRTPLLAATAPRGPEASPAAVQSHREVLRQASGEDINELVNPQLSPPVRKVISVDALLDRTLYRIED